MNLDYDDRHRELREAVRAWREEHAEEFDEHDRRSSFPRERYREGMQRGFGNVITPTDHGGTGEGAMAYAMVAEEIGLFQIAFQTQRALSEVGTPEQRERYLPRLADGSWVPAIAISEPETGSSLRSMDTAAERSGDGWTLEGRKSHVNLAAEADLHTVYAMTDEGLTVFLVEDDNPGLVVEEQRDPIGTRYLPIYDLRLEDCAVGEDAVLGEPGGGYDVFFATFNFSRIGNASEMLGHGKRALEAAIDWASERRVGDRTVTEFQGIRWMIAELATGLRGAELLRNEAARRLDRGEDAVLATSMAKLACANAALPATTEAMQITGAHGLYRDQPFERHFRDVKTLEVAGGSREIMKNVIADRLLE